MRVLVLYAHPVETSFSAALHRQVVESLRGRGHDVDDCDLNVEGFDPVMSRQQRLDYHNTAINRASVAPYVDRLLAAEAIVFVFPVWNYGFPAIMKGLLGVKATCDYLAHYDMNHTSPERRQRFIGEVKQVFERW